MTRIVIFDFDGVILDSMPIKTYAFKEIFNGFLPEDVGRLAEYHINNGGISRFVKIRYFFENILGQSVNAEEVQRYADMFSDIVTAELVKPKYLIEETMLFVRSIYGLKKLFIASGAEEGELRYLCSKFGIDKYFDGIYGSPTPKTELLRIILTQNDANASECVMIGDSMNDYEAAVENYIPFYGFNNKKLKEIGRYIDSFNGFYLD